MVSERLRLSRSKPGPRQGLAAHGPSFSARNVAGLWDVLTLCPQCDPPITGLGPATIESNHKNMRCLVLLLATFSLTLPPSPAQADAVSTAFNDAMAAFSAARAGLPAELAGVDVEAYGQALSSGRFASAHWGEAVTLDLHESADDGGSCARFAAYVQLPPRDGMVRLTLCPQFSEAGTPELRRLTVLHEMVHVVAGPDECRAMAFAAKVEQLATGSFTPVDRYWQANGCEGSGFSLP
jgi:hypothetical protein